MADPEHAPDLDDFDRTTVRLYRSGLTISALFVTMAATILLGAVAVNATEIPVVRDWVRLSWIGLAYGTGIAVTNLHLYDKRIRWTLNASAWLGVVLLLTAASMLRNETSWVAQHMGLGFLFVTHSGFALKERYCFRLPLVYLIPVLLAVSLFPLMLGYWLFAGTLLFGAGILMGGLAVAKDRMPLHYDVGDKSQYQH